jgi:CHAT domain-containing protein
MRSIGVLVVVLLGSSAGTRAEELADDLTSERRQELEKKAEALNNEGVRSYQAGDYPRAIELTCQALGIQRALYPKTKYPDGHPDLATTITTLGLLHKAAGEYGKAVPLLREGLEMRRLLYPKEKYPNGHPQLGLSITILGLLYQDAGEYSKAVPLLRETLDLVRAEYPKEKYPDGHPTLALSISTLGIAELAAGEYGKAEALFCEALDMQRGLYPKAKYPDGHPELASSINSLGFLHVDAREYGKAEVLLHEALAMRRALYPKAKYPEGHPELAGSINNLGLLHQATGEYGKAESLYREALDMCRVLYPKAKYPHGHRHLASTINNLAFLYLDAGKYRKAEPLFREALAVHRTLFRHYADLAAEAEALNFAFAQPPSRDPLLSVTRGRTNAAAVYDDLWDSRAVLTRLQEHRHRQLAASRDPDLRDLAEQLRLARVSLSRRLLHPLENPDENRAAITRLTEAKEELEKRLATRMKLPPLPKVEVPASRQLSQLLTAGTCFVDLHYYVHIAQDPDVKGKKGEKWTWRYVAFVVRPDAATARVELEDADTIEHAWADWYNAISAARPDEAAERKAAAALAHYIWEPLRKELPRDLHTVYLTADAALHEVPWGALPGAKAGTILLEEHAICLVPHGPFLLNRLQQKRQSDEAATSRLLAIGGIDYQDCAAAAEAPAAALREAALPARGVRWPKLDGTDKERQQVAALARRIAHLEVTERSGKEASTEQFQHDLPSARYAHIATHGFFADPQFRSALQIDPKEFGAAGVKDRRGGARSPLSLSGLVFAGANRSGEDAADDRGILTAEGLIGLRMEGLELAVLSACETGLGAYGGGEGVYGLQRAFHVAGCRNVVASLWKVDDDATQALMALFYANLWQKKLDPAEALRQAQLTLYRNPSAVTVAKRRGVDFTESDLPKVVAEPAEKIKHTPPAQWAAFTFSGVRPVRTD